MGKFTAVKPYSIYRPIDREMQIVLQQRFLYVRVNDIIKVTLFIPHYLSHVHVVILIVEIMG